MIRIKDTTHKRISAERILFPVHLVMDSDASILRYMRFSKVQPQLKRTSVEDVAYTLVSDLTEDADQLQQRFSKEVRYEIRRANKEEIKTCFYDSATLRQDPALVQGLKETYMHFCDVCGNQALKSVFDEDLLQVYAENGCAAITKAEFENGCVYHAYFFDDATAVLWYSASDFRNPNVDRNAAARANKLLHYKDMCRFKEQGVQMYDWGNVSTKDNLSPNGIDKFKASFGGHYQELYSYTVGNDMLGRILVAGKRILNKLSGGQQH